jgi:ribosomal protein L7/L12
MLYYKQKNGIWIDEYDVKRAYYISTGKQVSIVDADKDYLVWLYDKLGNSIVEVRRETDPFFVDELIKANQRLLAIKVLNRVYGFELVKAKEIVDKAEMELKANR